VCDGTKLSGIKCRLRQAFQGCAHNISFHNLKLAERRFYSSNSANQSRQYDERVDRVDKLQGAARFNKFVKRSKAYRSSIAEASDFELLSLSSRYRRDEAAAIEEGVQDATGKPPHTFDDFARDYASVFA